MSQEVNSYLTFSIGQNNFGVHVEKVLEIKEYIKPKVVPESMSYVKGVIDHRDHVIPVIDCAAKFNLGQVDITPQTCIVVLNIDKGADKGQMNIGIMVDSVSNVFEADEMARKNIETDYKPGYISGSYQIDDNFIMIINSDKVFSDKDIISLEEIIVDNKK